MGSDASIQQLEYEIKLNELQKVKRENSRSLFLTPTAVTLSVAFLSLLGTLIAHYNQRQNQLDLERKKFESELIVTAVKSNDAKTCRDNLKFLIEVGLISQNSVRLSKVIADTTVPLFQLKSYTNINPIYSLEGIIVLPKNMDFANAKLFIWPHSTNPKETYKLRQQIPIDENGRFKIMNLEEINYVVEVMYDDSLIKREMHSPNVLMPAEFKVFDLTKPKKLEAN